MSPTDRRDAILQAARPLVIEHGRSVTTRLIAEAAGIAEGTVFRVFASKDELIDAVLAREFDPTPYLDAIERIDPEQPLAARLLEATRILRGRFGGIFALMTALGVPKPPDHLQADEMRKRLADGGLALLLQPDAAAFRVPVEQVVALVRVLTFSASHPHLAGPDPMSAEEIVDVVLHGVLRTTPRTTGGETH